MSTITGQSCYANCRECSSCAGISTARWLRFIPTGCDGGEHLQPKAIFGIGEKPVGELVIGVKTPDQLPCRNSLNPSMKGKVVVGAFLSAATMTRAKGSSGWSSAAFTIRTTRTALGYDLGVAITGTEQVGFTLIPKEGRHDPGWRPRRSRCSPPMRDRKRRFQELPRSVPA